MKAFLRHILLLLVVMFAASTTVGAKSVQGGKVTVGVMLPLHDVNGDGKRMVEYYRGVLMACDSLKLMGMSVDVHAWNVPEEADITKTLKEKEASKCDLIIGPLYSKQVKPLADFAKKHDIKVLIPFSINTPEINTNDHLFQVYQSPETFNNLVISHFLDRFKGHHVIFVDCNDTTSRKGIFTFGLRKRLEAIGREYSITNVKSSEENFAKAFSRTLPNVVILNTGRSPELNLAFAKLNNMTVNYPNLKIKMFGYTEWMMYTKYNIDNFYKYEVHIPASYFYNSLSSRTARFQQKYRWNFHADMIQALPRFGITGFDQAFYFIRGLYLYGSKFVGAPGSVGYTATQMPLSFERISAEGGYRNNSILFVHYLPGHKVETIHF
ncbi:MAG: peptidoglycan-binding protein LysM [Prevotella sp.]